MYPAQTSFIPVQMALARFLESQGLKAIFANYPYWYLGTTPFRWLTGPVVPTLLAGFHQIFSKLSLFELFWGLLIWFWVLGGVGVYFFVKELTNSSTSEESLRATPVRKDRTFRGETTALLSAVFFIFGPIVPFLFAYSDGISLMAFSLLPFAWLAYLRFLRQPFGKTKIIFITTISFILLIDISIYISLFIGLVAIFLATQGWKKAEQKTKGTLIYLLIGLLVISFWYGPGYWWQILFSPSLAGKSLLSVIGQLGQLLPIALAITLAFVSAKLFKPKSKKSSSTYLLVPSRFAFYWLFIFGFLTLMRFIADPDFWLDWSSYGTELQFGLALSLALAVRKFGRLGGLGLLGGWILLFGYIFPIYVTGTMQKDITQSVEYRIGSWLDQSTVVANIERLETDSDMGDEGQAEKDVVFLSGSTVFWLNSFFDIPQVRGGNDGPSRHSDWRGVAWEVREGESGLEAVRQLESIGVDYLVVHDSTSAEFWHDFKYPGKFESAEGLEKVFDEKGDLIYKVN